VQAHIVLSTPPDPDDSWRTTPTWTAAARLPRTRVWSDPNGLEAQQFGAATSGQVLLYDAAGRRRWQGGLTSGRGLTGPNAGRAALLTQLSGTSATEEDTPVYGCPLIVLPADCTKGDPTCP
jgi:hypothetical protein